MLDTKPHAKDDLRLWLRLLKTTHRIESELKSRLQAEFGISLARFDLLAQLDRAPDGQTMTELSRHLLVTNAAVTGLADALIGEGLVSRLDDPGDRRRTILALSETGRKSFRMMADRHARWVEDLLSAFPDGDKRELDDLLKRLGESVQRRKTGL